MPFSHRSPHVILLTTLSTSSASIYEHPDPLAVGLRVDGTTRCSDGRTSRGLQGVNLEEMKCLEKMFWAAALEEDVFFQEHDPHLAHDNQACAECLTEGANFSQRCCVGVPGELVHGRA